MIRTVLTILAMFVAAAAAASSLFVVEQGEADAVYAFGHLDRVVTAPGPHLKWPAPLQNTVAIDLRARVLNAPQGDGYRTADGRNVVVGWFALWRVTDPAAFIRAFGVGSTEADDGVSRLVRDALRPGVARRKLDILLGAGAQAAADEAAAALAPELARRGVTLGALHLTTVGLSADQTSAIVAAMVAEQHSTAAARAAADAARARQIRSEGDAKAQAARVDAYRRAQAIRGDADARAAAINAAGYRQDPEFAAFFHSLQAYRESFGAHPPLFILEPSSSFLRYMANPGGRAQTPAVAPVVPPVPAAKPAASPRPAAAAPVSPAPKR